MRCPLLKPALAAPLLAAAHPALALEPMADAALAAVNGQGVAFNLVDYALSGDISLTYSGAAGQSLTLSGLAVSRGDDPATTFSDPYRLVVEPRAGLPDVIRFIQPANPGNLLGWQTSYDWAINDGNSVFNGGALVIDGLNHHSSSFSVSSPSDPNAQAIVWGQSVDFDLNGLHLRPQGRDSGEGELAISGLHLDAGGRPWVLADVSDQPGSFRPVSVNGESWLEFKIDWPAAGAADSGSLVVDEIRFHSPTPGFVNPATGLQSSSFSLGSSRIGGIQINHLHARLRPGS